MKRRALVIGGTGRLGSEVAHVLGVSADLCLVYKSDEKKALGVHSRLKTALPDTYIETLAHPLDTAASVASLFDKVKTSSGAGPDILVCCFGHFESALFLTETDSALAQTINEHLLIKLHLYRAFVGSMYRQRFGRIVSIGSISSSFVKRGQVAYAAANAGLEGMTKALALEVAGRGVTVNLVRAGMIDSESLVDHKRRLSGAGREIKKLMPVGRLGSEFDIARTVGFLCSDQADFVTGSLITIDGGRSLGDINL